MSALPLDAPIELTPLPSELRGERVRVRPLRRGDGVALFRAVDRSRAHLSRFLPWVDRHKTWEDSEVYVRKAIAWWTLREDLPLVVETLSADGDLGANEIIGASGLHRIDWTLRAFEVGYWVRVDATGKGFISEAVKLVVALAFERLAARRVEIRCEVDNLRSANVAQRLGFDEEARLPRQVRVSDGSETESRVFALDPVRYAMLPWRERARARVLAADEDG